MSACHMEFFSAGCNKTTQALSWNHNENLIAYSSCNSVILFKPIVENSSNQIEAVLNYHKGRVNCVQWIGQELVSGSVDKLLVLWKKQNTKWVAKQILTGHIGAIESLATLSTKEDGKYVQYIASSSADSSVKIWKSIGETEFRCIQTLTFGNGFALSLALSHLPNKLGIVLAIGCDDTSIRLYTMADNNFEQVISLRGHEDWVRCLSFHFASTDRTELMLACSSQDTFVRLWKITCKNTDQVESNQSVSLETQSFKAYSRDFMVVLESVLIGHEGWVMGLAWNPTEALCVLTASMDRTLIIWEYDDENALWMDKARFGEVGGNTLGYYGCDFSPFGNVLIAHGYQGSFQLWKKVEDKWESAISISGHFGEVEDFDWSPSGDYAITASTDQTTRLFVPWKRSTPYKSTWHEIARPQIHGYDMKCITVLNKYKYASGGQEKVARVFGAPRAFYNSLEHITSTKDKQTSETDLPIGATVPVLGLSNKAVFEADLQTWENENKADTKAMKASAFANEDPAPFNPTLIATPPVEDVLLQHTLWPEIQKLYGHGFELFCMASDHDGSTLATACRASKQEHANIIIWNTTTWQQVDSLCNAHTLTVTQLAFSKLGTYLLSVSRDRTWALHRRDQNEKYKFTLVQKTDKKTSVHTRIIWSCAWCPDEKYFVTASRDKKVLVWGKEENTECWSTRSDSLDMGEPVTAVCVHDMKTDNERYVIAVGTETGKIGIYTWLNDWKLIQNIDFSYLFRCSL